MWKKILIVSSVLTGCFAPEYSENYISVNEADFQRYQQEALERPSPPARTSMMFGDTKVYVTYSQPGVKGREIWDDLVKYDKIWRTGANEATVLSTTGDVLINGDTVLAGNYALYTIPTKDNWTIILNTKYDVWGAYDYEIEKDVMRFEVTPYTLDEMKERMSFEIQESGKLSFAWKNLGFDFNVDAL